MCMQDRERHAAHMLTADLWLFEHTAVMTSPWASDMTCTASEQITHEVASADIVTSELPDIFTALRCLQCCPSCMCFHHRLLAGLINTRPKSAPVLSLLSVATPNMSLTPLLVCLAAVSLPSAVEVISFCWHRRSACFWCAPAALCNIDSSSP